MGRKKRVVMTVKDKKVNLKGGWVMPRKPFPSISANDKYIHFEGIFPPKNVTGMAIGDRKIMKFYIDDDQYYEGEVMKIAETEDTEDFKIINRLILNKEIL